MSKHNKQSDRIRRGEESESGMDTDLHKLFLDQLADMYDAEQQLTKALPKMAKAAESDELRETIESHLEETEEHVSRLEEVAESINETLKRQTCPAMKGLIEESEELIKDHKGATAIDAAIIAAAQKVEHYEIATYGTLAAWAELMGHDEAAKLLRQTEDEESAADEKLTEVAENIANQRAQAE